MDLFLVAIILWGLIALSGILFVWGFIKRSWFAFLLSGFLFLIPAIIFVLAEGWVRGLVFLPLVAFILSYYTKLKS